MKIALIIFIFTTLIFAILFTVNTVENTILKTSNDTLQQELDKTNNIIALKDASLIDLESQVDQLKEKNSDLILTNAYIEYLKTREIKLRDFNSTTELAMFLLNDPTNNFPYITNGFDCEDYALTLSRNAYEHGYFMGIMDAILNTEAERHMSCFAIIGNDIYMIEPQSDAYLLWSKLD
jgi:hypothetical protein